MEMGDIDLGLNLVLLRCEGSGRGGSLTILLLWKMKELEASSAIF